MERVMEELTGRQAGRNTQPPAAEPSGTAQLWESRRCWWTNQRKAAQSIFRRRSASLLPVICCFVFLALPASFAWAQHSVPMPYLRRNGEAVQMMVNGKPYLILAGELHNSSASSVAYMRPIWPRLETLHLNTVIGTVSWELVEPEEGHFDFSLVDAQLRAARAHSMHLILIWFATYKNASSKYVPIWVKRDNRRFFWAAPDPANPGGLYALSAFCQACRDADANAFRRLMRHLRTVDPQHTVIMIQVENEMGIMGAGRDYSAAANAAWSGPVPIALMQYLQLHRDHLRPALSGVWARNGYRMTGTWAQVFGPDAYGQEIFSAWYFARYVSAVVDAGKQELALPMYVNAWIVQNSHQRPGDYPSGGPVARMMDVWRAGAPGLDLFAPDIYINDVDSAYRKYVVSGNPLFFPESRPIPGNYIWAIGHYNAMGVSPFGVDDLQIDDPLGMVYQQLSGATSLITHAQSTGTIAAIEPRGSGAAEVHLGGFDIHATYTGTHASGYALLINSRPDEFCIMGTNLTLSFDRPPGQADDYVMYDLEEGTFKAGEWVPGRHLNGDEGPGLRELGLPSGFVVWRVRLYRHASPGLSESQ